MNGLQQRIINHNCAKYNKTAGKFQFIDEGE